MGASAPLSKKEARIKFKEIDIIHRDWIEHREGNSWAGRKSWTPPYPITATQLREQAIIEIAEEDAWEEENQRRENERRRQEWNNSWCRIFGKY